jgi:heptaprenyl diphosphate synthase/octaprenyl-diphosphate synthase
LIYAVAEGGSSQLRELARTLRPPTPDHAPELLAAVIASGGAARAIDEARATAARAVDQLADFPPSQTTRALVEICGFVLNRQA